MKPSIDKDTDWIFSGDVLLREGPTTESRLTTRVLEERADVVDDGKDGGWYSGLVNCRIRILTLPLFFWVASSYGLDRDRTLVEVLS